MAQSTSTHIWRLGTVGTTNQIGERAFAGGIAAFTALAIFVTLLGQQYTHNFGITNPGWVLLIGLVVVIFAGVGMMSLSKRPGISFAGLMLLSGGFGLLLGVSEPGIAVRPLAISLIEVVVLGLVGWFIPANLQSWASWLLGLTVTVLALLLVLPFISYFGLHDTTYQMPTWLSWGAVLLFSAWLIFDWNKARRMPRTLDNMIDGAGAVYLDWINLYLWLQDLLD